MLRNVSDLILASVSHYEILEGERFGPMFAPIRTASCFFFFGGGGGGACEHSTIDLLVCSGFITKNSHGSILKNVLKRLEMDEN